MRPLTLLTLTALGFTAPGPLDIRRDKSAPGMLRVGARYVATWIAEGDDPPDAPLDELERVVPGIRDAVRSCIETGRESVGYKIVDKEAVIVRIGHGDTPVDELLTATGLLEYCDVKASNQRVKVTIRLVLLSVDPAELGQVAKAYATNETTIVDAAQLELALPAEKRAS